MKPLTEIVAELERRTGGIRTRSMEKTIEVNEQALIRLLAAFRAGEKLAKTEYTDNSGGEYTSRCPHCENRLGTPHAEECPLLAWDAAVKGDE